MGMKLYNESNIQSIADAIRAKNGTNNTYTVFEMAPAISNLDASANFWAAINRTLTTLSDSSISLVGYGAFNNCKNLTNVNLPNCSLIQSSAFTGCSSLTSLLIPSCKNIYSYAFSGCQSLYSVALPECSSLSYAAFDFCINLSFVSLPKCTYIGQNAFHSCFNLLSLYVLNSSVCTLSTNAFSSTPISNYTTYTGGVYGSIYVPASLLTSYQAATNWVSYSARMVAIESIG